MDAPAPDVRSDPRFKAGVRLRRAGRHEAAVRLLTEVLALATEGKPEAAQRDPRLAPLYYEYGVALMGVWRDDRAAAADAPAAAAEPAADEGEGGPSPKRRKLEGEAADADDDDDDDDDEDDEDDASDASDGDDDAAVAWQLVDQARCLFLDAGDKAAAARCAEQLAGLDVEQARWADAVVEFSFCVDWYEESDPAALEDKVHHLSCVAGLAAAYAEHARAAPGADVTVEGEGGAPTAIASGAEVAARAASYAKAAEAKTGALLSSLAAAGDDLGAAAKRDLCGLAVEVSHAKDLVAGLGGKAEG